MLYNTPYLLTRDIYRRQTEQKYCYPLSLNMNINMNAYYLYTSKVDPKFTCTHMHT